MFVLGLDHGQKKTIKGFWCLFVGFNYGQKNRRRGFPLDF